MTNLDNAAPPPADAEALIRLIAANGRVSFRTLDDTAEDRKTANKAVTRGILYGPLERAAQALLMLNAKGAGIFFVPNETGALSQGRAVTDKDVTAIRALWVDLDGSPLDPVLACGLEPHAIVETSAARFHVYWLVRDFPLDMFKRTQTAIAERFNGDRSVCNPGRIMRLPGFANNKPGKGRFIGRIKSLRADLPHYGLQAVLQFLAPNLAPPALPKEGRVRTYSDAIPKGQRNNELWKRAQGFQISGITGEGPLLQRLLTINEQYCQPPMSYEELKRIVASVMANPPAGFAALPWALLDSPEWQRLPHASRSIVTYAYRRFNGRESDRIAIPYNDYANEWKDSKVFYKWRSKAVKGGLLKITRPKGWCPIEKKNLPTLFGLVYLPETRASKQHASARALGPFDPNGVRAKTPLLERSSALAPAVEHLRPSGTRGQNDEPEDYAEADKQGALDHGRLSVPVLEDFGSDAFAAADLAPPFADDAA